MRPSLVILAAGIGSRYGGLKQIEPVGPGGATIMDYSIYDALRAGFGKIVFVIRPEMETQFRTEIAARWTPRVPVAYAHQALDALPAGFRIPANRIKPWGTGQAVLSAAKVVQEPFAVVNADDFYGASSFRILGDSLRAEPAGGVPEYAMVGYRLRDTLSARGTVARAVCRCAPEGWLESIVEIVGLEKHGADARCQDERGAWRTISGDELVSMNLWGFRPAFFAQLRASFERFLHEQVSAGAENAVKSEFYLPAAVQDAIRAGAARVRVLPGREAWAGVTHRADADAVAALLRERAARGEYPEALWG